MLYSERFQRFMPLVLKHEGGYVNHPADPGGATNQGVTQRVYDKYRADEKKEKQSVAKIEKDEVLEIYFKQYYLPLDCDKIKSEPYAYCLLDLAINSGVGKAKTFQVSSNEDVIKLLDMREAFFKRIVEVKPTSQVFLKGWLNRLDGIAKDFKIRWKAKR